MNDRSDLLSQLSELLLSYSKGNLVELFSTYLREYYSDEVKYWEMLTSFLPSIVSNESFKEETSEFIQSKVEEISNEFEGYNTEMLRSATSTFLFELWNSWEEIISKDQSSQIMNILKYLARCDERAVQYCAIAQMFKLLDLFTSSKNPAAPVLYKALIFIMIDNHKDDTTRQF